MILKIERRVECTGTSPRLKLNDMFLSAAGAAAANASVMKPNAFAIAKCDIIVSPFGATENRYAKIALRRDYHILLQREHSVN